MNTKTIAEVMQLATEMAKEKKGSLFVITKVDISKHYELLYPELFKGKKVNIFEPSTKVLLLKMSDLDGGIVIKDNGDVEAYGAKIKMTKVLFGHGTRHSAAKGISKINGVMSILSSEEDGMIRIFRDGELAAEINPETGKDQRFIEKLAELFSKTDIQVATSGGVASLLLGLHPLMAGAIFTGSWIITKYGFASIKDFVKTGKIVIKEEITKTKPSEIHKVVKKAKSKGKKKKIK